MADAPGNQLTYYGLDRPTLPYKTNTSPVDETPHFVTGSKNVMGTIKGYLEKRPGFSTPVEQALSEIPGKVVRLYTWRRFSGSFFIMASVTTTNPISPSQVWKLEVGVDQSFVMIYADTSSTSAFPFDFITSNNFCYFGNQTIRKNMQKFNGSDVTPGIHTSLWGLDFPVAAPATTLVTGALPPGLTFNGTSLVGTPSTAGTYAITFTATDFSGDTATQSMSFQINTTALDWQFPSGPINNGQKGVAYTSNDLQVWGGVPAYTYTLASGALPVGLSLNATTGVLSGTPTGIGNYDFAINVTDSAGTSITREYSLFIGDPTISIASPSPNTGTVGIAYTGAVTVSGGTAPYSYAIVAGTPPAGLTMDSAGNITGTPAAPGVYTVTFQVMDSNGVTNQITTSYTISSNILAIATVPAPPIGKVGYAYSFSPFASGGTNNEVKSSTNNVYTGDWQFVGTQFRTHLEPATTALSDLNFLGFGFTVPATATILGITVSAEFVSAVFTTSVLSQVALWYSNAVLGTIKTPMTPFTTTVTTQTFGTTTDNWGATLTPAIVNDPSFGFAMAVNAPNRVFIGQPFQVTVYYAYPSAGITLSASPNAITAQTGYVYGQSFTSIYGHESSVSALSPSTSVFTNLDVRVNVLSSTDPQVNGINIYRSTDGGDADPSIMRLVAQLPNADASYVDSTLDINLGLQTGPALYVNDPPQPLNGFVWSNGRIWGINQSVTWFTGNEEVTNGIPEECMSDAINGNFYAWPSEVGGMAVTSNGVDIGLDEQFWQISGDALATFRKSKLLAGGGTRYPINIIDVGDSVFWLDTALQAFSSSDGEFGEAIRPDLSRMDLSQSFIVFHKSKLYNWIVILDAINSTMYVYDLDLNQWQTPWVFDGQPTAITSGETSVGNIQLIVAFETGHVMYLTPNTFTDDGSDYADVMKSNLFSVVPGRGTTSRNAAEVRKVAQFDMEVSKTPIINASYPNAELGYKEQAPDFFACLVDDDPIQAVQTDYFDLSANKQPPQYQDRTIQKKYIAPVRWTVDQAVPPARRIALFAQWNESPNGWQCYSLDLGWRT